MSHRRRGTLLTSGPVSPGIWLEPDPKGNVLEWNPSMGIHLVLSKTDQPLSPAQTMSPALVLLHEAAHAEDLQTPSGSIIETPMCTQAAIFSIDKRKSAA